MPPPELIRAFYVTLAGAWGPQHWWPARTRFEVIVGAFLTQNTAWTNVERALRNLRRAGLLTLAGVRSTPLPHLERMLRPAGYFRQKAARLKHFVAWLDTRYGGSLTRMFAIPTAELRQQLLALNGVGPETADSILLYAGNHPVFVVDAYTRRIVERHQLLSPSAAYEEIRALFESALADPRIPSPPLPSPPPLQSGNRERETRGAAHHPSPMSTAQRTALAQTYNEMHALIVGVGKSFCSKSQPQCELCPLRPFLPPHYTSAPPGECP